ncbi:MAG: hypothetical protein JWL86_2655, partial [Rhizobium sp.]|nr:hypothetical protein [Rhizobium sp.]
MPSILKQALRIGAALSVLFAANFAHATPDAAEWAKIIEAAKKEGKVVVYSGYVSPNTHK